MPRKRIEPADVVFWTPPGLKKFKLDLFNRIAATIVSRGGASVVGDYDLLDHKVKKGRIPIIGCTPELRPYLDRWISEGRDWIYWDRGFFRRVFATDLPTGHHGGFYRWIFNGYQMGAVKDVPSDRWLAADTPLTPWRPPGRHIVIAEPSATYQRFHGIEGWTERTVAELRRQTDRPLVFRDKEMQRSGRKLRQDLEGAHALVTHGSNAAVEAVIMGCPVFVHAGSAAALVGLTDLALIETPARPDREPWCWSLAYSQFSERELVDGTLWRLLEMETPVAKRLDFTQDFTFTPEAERRISTKYKAGMRRQLVTDECAVKALTLGRAVLTKGDQPGSPAPAMRGNRRSKGPGQ